MKVKLIIILFNKNNEVLVFKNKLANNLFESYKFLEVEFEKDYVRHEAIDRLIQTYGLSTQSIFNHLHTYLVNSNKEILCYDVLYACLSKDTNEKLLSEGFFWSPIYKVLSLHFSPDYAQAINLLRCNIGNYQKANEIMFNAGSFSTSLIDWFSKNKRDLPFRKFKNPYYVWISEIMAQQTQITTLLPYYHRFIEAFPTVFELAKAPIETVYKSWEGLGYYSRARNLHKAANVLVKDYDGIFPRSYDELLKLPGIGPYTAGAISSIVFGLPCAAVDGNVFRVITRVMECYEDITKVSTRRVITNIVELLMNTRHCGDFNEALMELGATHCSPTSPNCFACPVAYYCSANKNNTQLSLPVKKQSLKPTSKNIEVLVLKKHDKYLFIKNNASGLLSNLWGFPIVEATDVAGVAVHNLSKNYTDSTTKLSLIGQCQHIFSHQKWQMNVYTNLNEITSFCAEEKEPYIALECFRSLNEIDTLTISTAFKKVLKLIK